MRVGVNAPDAVFSTSGIFSFSYVIKSPDCDWLGTLTKKLTSVFLVSGAK